MGKFTEADAARIAEKIKQNVDAVWDKMISNEEFHARQEEYWNEVMRGEACIIGSKCAQRKTLTLRALGFNA